MGEWGVVEEASGEVESRSRVVELVLKVGEWGVVEEASGEVEFRLRVVEEELGSVERRPRVVMTVESRSSVV